MEELPLAQWTPLPWFLVSPPLPGAAMLPRPRLEQLLDDSVAQHPITLVAAASGYGKTAMLAAWSRKSVGPVAWLTLNDDVAAGDAQFLGGMISALRRIAPGLDAAQAHILSGLAVDPRGADATVEHIAVRCAALTAPVTLIVDHAGLAGPALARGPLRVLAEHCPGLFRFVLAGEPALADWFNNMVAVGGARSIGAGQLALTVEEIGAELAQPGTGLEAADAARILSETGGWPIAVHLARMGSLTGVDGSGAEVLTEYVASQVLGGLDAELADFILAASTCARLDATTAQILTGNPRSAELLEQCANQGIFLEHFVGRNEQTLYEWHAPFARQCRILLGRRNPALSRELNLRAAQALAAEFPAEAIGHAMAGADHDGALDILRGAWLRIVIDAGAVRLNGLCLDLLAQLGPVAEVLLVRACCLDAMGDITGSDILAAQARTAMAACGPAPAAADSGRRATQAFAELFLDDDGETLGAAVDDAREAMNADHIDAAGYAYRLFFLGWTELRLRRNPAEAVRLLKSALREAEATGMGTLLRRIRGNLTFALSYGGYFTAARALMDSRNQDGDDDELWNHYDGGIEPFARGYMDFWQDRIPQAQKLFTEMVDRGGHPASYTALARVYLALSAAATGDARELRAAESHLGGISAVDQHGVPWPAYRLLATAGIASASGDHAGAAAQLAGLQPYRNIPVVLAHAAEMYRKAGRPADAMVLLSRIHGAGMVSYVAASALVTSAVVARGRGEREAAHNQLEQALDIAAPLSIARPFNRSDDALLGLLTEHAAWGTSHEGFLAARIALGDEAVSRHEILGAQLSTREREVFGYLCTTMTAEEIAGALFVSVNTVRTHQRSIYRKLGVGTRREAIKFRP